MSNTDTDNESSGEEGILEVPIPWRLERVKSIFEHKRMVERVAYRKVLGFIHHNLGISYTSDRYMDGVGKFYKTEREFIKKYASKYNDVEEYFDTAYVRPKHGWGRDMPVDFVSMSVAHRPTRHGLCQEFYEDKDISSCQPTIIAQVAKSNGVLCPAIAAYVANPKKYKAEIAARHGCTEEVAKNLPTSMSFGQTYDGWAAANKVRNVTAANKHPLFVRYEQEARVVRDIVYNANKDTILEDVKQVDKKSKVKRWDNLGDEKRGIMGLWAQEMEARVMGCAVEALVELGHRFEDVVPCQDGVMLLPAFCAKFPGERELDNIMSQAVFDRFRIRVEWKTKPFDEAIDIPMYDGLIKSHGSFNEELCYVMLAERLMRDFGDYIVKTTDGRLFVYHGEFQGNRVVRGGRWYDESVELCKMLRIISVQLYDNLKKEIADAINLKDKDKDVLLELIRKRTDDKVDINKIMFHLRSLAGPPKKQFDDNLFLLGFENGVYDLQNDLFRPHQYEDYLTLSAGYDYVPKENIDGYEELKTRLDTILEAMEPEPDELRFKMQVQASGLDGRNYQMIVFNNGKGGNCKGWSYESLSRVLGGQYYINASNKLLAECGDANSASPALANLRQKRLICFEETKSIELAVAKKLSGGNRFRARQLYGKETEFPLQATIVINSNKATEIDGSPSVAEARRFLDSFFSTNFTADESLVGTTNGEYTFRRADETLDSESLKESLKLPYLHTLLDVYRKHKGPGDTGIKFDKTEKVLKRSKALIASLNLFSCVLGDMIEPLPGGELSFIDLFANFTCSVEYTECKHKTDYTRKKFYAHLRETYPANCENPRNNGFKLKEYAWASQGGMQGDDKDPEGGSGQKRKRSD